MADSASVSQRTGAAHTFPGARVPAAPHRAAAECSLHNRGKIYCIIEPSEFLGRRALGVSRLPSATKRPERRDHETSTDETRTLEAPTHETDNRFTVPLQNVLVADLSAGASRISTTASKMLCIVFHRGRPCKPRGHHNSLALRHLVGGVGTFHE